MSCLSDDTVARVAMGLASVEELTLADLHLDGCEVCRQVLAAAVPLAEGALVPAPVAGRYELLRLHGAGAMGVVWAARDTRLDRPVALKLLRQGAAQSPAEEARLQARVSHPNVVQVFDVGEADGQAFVAMEFVEGSTLRRWLRQPRSREAILRVFHEAGQGLAAAHRAGLVHRDFKPDNVLVDVSGRARVADFGLAAMAERVSHRRAGTPAYMAPEQFAGGAVGPHSDQFGYCVALVEALTGQRPRAGERGWGLPSHLEQPLARGLTPAPEARFPSMEALLEALSAKPSVVVPVLIAVGVTVLLSLALGLAMHGDPLPERPPPMALPPPPAPVPASPVVTPSPGPHSEAPHVQTEEFKVPQRDAPLPPSGQLIVVAVGDTRPFVAVGVTRAQIDRPDVLDAEGLEGQLLLTGVAAGRARLSLEFEGGKTSSWPVEVREARPVAPVREALPVGVSRRLEVSELLRVAVGDPSIIDVSLSPDGQLDVRGKAPGTTNLFVWTRDARRLEYQFDVSPPALTASLELQLGLQRAVRLPPFDGLRAEPADLFSVVRVSGYEVLLTPLRAGQGRLVLELAKQESFQSVVVHDKK